LATANDENTLSEARQKATDRAAMRISYFYKAEAEQLGRRRTVGRETTLIDR